MKGSHFLPLCAQGVHTVALCLENAEARCTQVIILAVETK